MATPRTTVKAIADASAPAPADSEQLDGSSDGCASAAEGSARGGIAPGEAERQLASDALSLCTVAVPTA
jgi:hypothetical protein